jgi:hypothetical protein
MRAGFSAEGQLTKLSTRQLWLVVSKFFASEKSAGRSSNANAPLASPAGSGQKIRILVLGCMLGAPVNKMNNIDLRAVRASSRMKACP